MGGLRRLLPSVVAHAGRAGSLLLAQHGNVVRGIQNEPRLSKQHKVIVTFRD